jgi:hypothetical protein
LQAEQAVQGCSTSETSQPSTTTTTTTSSAVFPEPLSAASSTTSTTIIPHEQAGHPDPRTPFAAVPAPPTALTISSECHRYAPPNSPTRVRVSDSDRSTSRIAVRSSAHCTCASPLRDRPYDLVVTISKPDWLPERHLGVAATLSHADELIGQVADLLFDAPILSRAVGRGRAPGGSTWLPPSPDSPRCPRPPIDRRARHDERREPPAEQQAGHLAIPAHAEQRQQRSTYGFLDQPATP